VLLSLLVNFVGDGLRDAFDPRQKRVVFRRVKDLPADATVETGTTSDVPDGAIADAAQGQTGSISSDPDRRRRDT
jgi:peptide/nickel transport system permease protein